MRTLGNTGLQVSRLGFGAAPLGNEYGGMESAEAKRAIDLAIDNGINFFDVAAYYGRTLAETRLGEMLKGRRHEVILATKCARYGLAEFDFSAERVTRSADESLQRLQTDYLDILHVHDVEFGDKRQIVDETIPALRRVQQAGKARFIGITGLSLRMLREVAAEAPVDCMLTYCRYNLLNIDATTMDPNGLINASPMHMGLLTPNGPPPWHPATPVVREAARRIVEFCQSQGVSVTDTALQFALSNPKLATTFTGMSTTAEVLQNLKAMEGTADPEILKEIEILAEPARGRIWKAGRPENYDPNME
ncbi:MAG: aldo/keto reductase [Bryobacteraceae bacterium]